MRLAVGLLLALCSTLALNASYLGQHGATNELERLEFRRPLHGLGQLFTHPVWLAAYLGGWVGWAAYVAALRFAPLSLVQSISAGGVALLVWFSRTGGRPSSRRERDGALLASLGLVCVVVSLHSVERAHDAGLASILVLVAVGLGVALLLVLLLRGPHAIGPALAAGLCYGVGDVATKGAVSGSWLLVPIFLGCHLLGFVATQLAYQRGTLIESAGLSSLLMNAIPLAAGLALFGEAPPGGALGALRVVGFVGVLAGAALIARRTAATGTHGGLVHPGEA